MTASVHHQGHPWGRTLPLPASIAPYNASNFYSDQRISDTNSATFRQDIVTGPQVEWSGRNFVPDTQVVCHKDNSQQESTQVAPITATDLRSPEPDEPMSQHHDDIVASAEDARRSSSPSTSSTIECATKFCLCQDEPHIPRPRNAFILFRQHQHAGVVAQNPGLPNPDISKIIGEQWRRLSEKTKEGWKALAEDEKMRHSQQYPDYRYRPRRSGRHSILSSISGPSSTATEIHPSCRKCGGKVVSAPIPPPSSIPPPTSSSTHASEGDKMNPTMSRTSHDEYPFSPPQSSSNPYNHEKFSPPGGRPDVAHYQQRSHQPAIPNNHVSSTYDQTEAKRRRLNGNVAPFAGRGTFPDHYRPVREQHLPKTGTTQLAPLQIAPQAVQLTRANFQYPIYTPTQRNDPNLVLPPLQTLPTRGRNQSDGWTVQAQRLGVEAMIMSIPVLNKIKILSQISPSLPVPSPSTPAPDIRGAVIAVEGMEASTVHNMMATLAEQLERDGKFAVRIFGGPVPYSMLDKPSNGAINGINVTMGIPDCLDLITQWHAVSKEIKDYITTGSNTSCSQRVSDCSTGNITSATAASHSYNTQIFRPATHDARNKSSVDTTASRTTISAVSPRTLSRTRLSSDDPMRPQPNGDHQTVSSNNPESARPKSRIPAAALAQQVQPMRQPPSENTETRNASPATEQRRSLSGEEQAAHTTSLEPQLSETQTSLPPLASNGPSKADRPPIRTRPQTPIPIALVPHYQLTTVNALAVTIPIKDSYSPHSHWQWLATLWRGCIGPDITIVMKSTLDDGDFNSASDNIQSAGGLPSAHPITPASSHPYMGRPGQARPSPAPYSANQTTQATGVDIRLTDAKTIIVKTGSARYGQDRRSFSSAGIDAGSDGTSKLSITDILNSESWEKAKRRVGFEVEEYLRK